MAKRRRPFLPVSAVVCAKNRANVIDRCVRALSESGAAEVIVVIDDPEDSTARLAAAAGALIITNERGGLAAARQRGAQAARQPFVAYVDSDAVVAADTLPRLLEDAGSEGLDAVEATLLTLEKRPSYWQRGEQWRRGQLQAPAGSPIGCIVTLVRRSLVLDIGFDEVFSGAAEDGDFFYRAVAAGAAIGRSSRAVAYHEDRRTLRAFAAQRIWHGRGLARIMVRHRGPYRASVSARVNQVRPAMALRFVPFMATSVGLLGIGVVLEMLRIAASPNLRRRLRSRPPEAS